MEKNIIAENLESQNLESQNLEIPKEKKKRIISQNSEKGKRLMEKKEEEKIKMNFGKFASLLDGKKIPQKGIREGNGDYLYNYPEEWNKMQISGIEGKNFRNKRRKDMQSLNNSIFWNYQKKDAKGLKDSIENWIGNYKKYYRINDFSISSISQSSDNLKNQDIELSLNIIKEFLGGNEKMNKGIKELKSLKSKK